MRRSLHFSIGLGVGQIPFCMGAKLGR